MGMATRMTAGCRCLRPSRPTCWAVCRARAWPLASAWLSRRLVKTVSSTSSAWLPTPSPLTWRGLTCVCVWVGGCVCGCVGVGVVVVGGGRYLRLKAQMFQLAPPTAGAVGRDVGPGYFAPQASRSDDAAPPTRPRTSHGSQPRRSAGGVRAGARGYFGSRPRTQPRSRPATSHGVVPRRRRAAVAPQAQQPNAFQHLNVPRPLTR